MYSERRFAAEFVSGGRSVFGEQVGERDSGVGFVGVGVEVVEGDGLLRECLQVGQGERVRLTVDGDLQRGVRGRGSLAGRCAHVLRLSGNSRRSECSQRDEQSCPDDRRNPHEQAYQGSFSATAPLRGLGPRPRGWRTPARGHLGGSCFGGVERKSLWMSEESRLASHGSFSSCADGGAGFRRRLLWRDRDRRGPRNKA